MPRKSAPLETGLRNVDTALSGALRIKKALKKASSKKTPPKEKATDFIYGANVPAAPPLRPKYTPVKSLPVKSRKTIAGLVDQITRNSPKLDSTLKPGQMLSIQIKGEHNGKKFVNKSVKTFTNYSELARFLNRYSFDTKTHKRKSNKDQAQLIDSIQIISFPGFKEKQYLSGAFRSQTLHEQAKNKRKKAYQAERKEEKKKIKVLTSQLKSERKQKQAEKRQKQAAKKQAAQATRQMKAFKRKLDKQAKEIAALRKLISKPAKKATKKGAKKK